MQWNLPLGDPRQNVLVRQIRFEAWENWNMAATIACIPALLELAVTLFLGGVVVLLWTLDDTVAILVTVVTAIFFGIVGAFTILPIFLKRCPYKSPTAWACAIAFHFVQELFSAPLRIYKSFRSLTSDNPHILFGQTLWNKTKLTLSALILSLQEFHSSAQAETWRAWDLHSCRDPTGNDTFQFRRKSSTDLRTAAEQQLKLEAREFDAHGVLVERPVPYWLKDRTPALFTNIGETSYLLRALSWVKTASQSSHIDLYIDECVQSIHPPFDAKDEPLSGHWYQVQAISTWCLALSTRNCFHSPYDPLLHAPIVDHGEPFHPARDPTISELRKALQVYRVSDASGTDSTLPQHHHRSSLMTRWPLAVLPLPELKSNGDESEWNNVLILFRTVISTVQRLLSDLASRRDSLAVKSPTVLDTDVRRIFELFMLALGISHYCNSLGSRSMIETPWYIDLIQHILTDSSPRKHLLEQLAPGLRLEAFIHACRHAKIQCLPATEDNLAHLGKHSSTSIPCHCYP